MNNDVPNNSNQQPEQMIYCPRCGSEMKSNARYCMKCGNLNYNHEANQSMKEIMGDEAINQATTYQIGASGVVSNVPVKGVKTQLATNTGSDLFCFIINYVLYIVSLAAIILPKFSKDLTLQTLTSFDIAIPVTLVSLFFLYFYSIELIFMKCNKRWWHSVIPIYNLFVLAEITYGKKIYAILFFIPVVGQIFWIGVLYRLGVKFRYNGIVTLLFLPFVIPHMALSTSMYNDTIYVSGSNKSLEVRYGRRQVFIATTILLFLFSFSAYLYNNQDELKHIKRLIDNIYYVYTAKTITNKVRTKMDHKFYTCKTDEVYNSTEGSYYFNFPDIGRKVALPFYHSRDAIEGYVRVEFVRVSENKTERNFYISISDGSYGFAEINIKDLKLEDVVKYEAVDTSFLDQDVRLCNFGT